MFCLAFCLLFLGSAAAEVAEPIRNFQQTGELVSFETSSRSWWFKLESSREFFPEGEGFHFHSTHGRTLGADCRASFTFSETCTPSEKELTGFISCLGVGSWEVRKGWLLPPQEGEVPVLHAPVEEPSLPSQPGAVTSYLVGVWVDQYWTNPSNNPWSSTADTLGLFNDINEVYVRGSSEPMKVQMLGSIHNPYNTGNRVGDMYGILQNKIKGYPNSSFTNHIWLVGNNVGGLGAVRTSCNPSAPTWWKISVAGLVSYSRLWTVKTMAHEIGHNRAALHDFQNQCNRNSPTPNCQCSVMSYCWPNDKMPSGAVNYFSYTSISQMKDAGCY